VNDPLSNAMPEWCANRSEAPELTAPHREGGEQWGESPAVIVKQAFEDWMNGTGNVGRIFAPQMKWEVFGSSATSGRYESAAEFATNVLVPLNERFVDSDPLRPTQIRALYADGPTVIVIWDGKGTTVLGTPYENTYAWIFTFDQGLVVEASAFYDAVAFDEMWAITPRER
jgi:uncharacterized protein